MLQTSFLLMKSLNKTETSIFLSVVCSLFPKAIFLTFIGSRYLNTYSAELRFTHIGLWLRSCPAKKDTDGTSRQTTRNF